MNMTIINEYWDQAFPIPFFSFNLSIFLTSLCSGGICHDHLFCYVFMIENRSDFTFIEHDASICNFLYFRYFQSVYYYSLSLLCKLKDQSVDFTLGSYVYTLCRVIEQKDLCSCVKPSGKEYFLLVTSA